MKIELKEWFSKQIGLKLKLNTNFIEVKSIYKESDKAFLFVLSEHKYYTIGNKIIIEKDYSVFHNDKSIFGIWILKSVILNLNNDIQLENLEIRDD